MANAWLESLIGSRFSILKADQQRYEGTLTQVDVDTSFIILSQGFWQFQLYLIFNEASFLCRVDLDL